VSIMLVASIVYVRLVILDLVSGVEVCYYYLMKFLDPEEYLHSQFDFVQFCHTSVNILTILTVYYTIEYILVTRLGSEKVYN
jgi:hypothetical protein